MVAYYREATCLGGRPKKKKKKEKKKRKKENPSPLFAQQRWHTTSDSPTLEAKRDTPLNRVQTGEGAQVK